MSISPSPPPTPPDGTLRNPGVSLTSPPSPTSHINPSDTLPFRVALTILTWTQIIIACKNVQEGSTVGAIASSLAVLGCLLLRGGLSTAITRETKPGEHVREIGNKS